MPEWTPAQQNAINARGGTVLVSAAAGSGKTAVLVERVIQILLDEHTTTDVDHLLIVTFTNAAAAEMRDRISKAIAMQLLQHPGNQHLLRQQMLLPGAKICTIDAFCKDLIQEHFQELPIGQDFRILEESEKKLMEAETVTEVLEDLYEEGRPAFFSLVELLSTAKNDNTLHSAILKLHDYIMAHPFPLRWLEQMCGMYQSEEPLDHTVWAQLIQRHTHSVLTHLQAQLQSCYTMLEQDGVLYDKVKPILDGDLLQISALLEGAQAWDKMRALLNQFQPARFPSIRGYGDDPVKNQIAAIRKEVKKSVETLENLYCATADEHREDLEQLAPIVEELAGAVGLLHTRLMERKAQENALSFGDIEQFALHLLVKDTQDGRMERTALALELQSKYHEILIDEYQDTNRAQDLLFHSLSNDANLFMVGDVKQSIYRFRLAMPQIFMEKKAQFYPYDGKRYPAQIVLDQNFRSRHEICSFINFIFTLLFSKEVGELEYKQDEALQAGAIFPETDQMPPSLHILKADGLEAKDTDAYEAEYLVQLIQEKIKSGALISDKKGGLRKANYGDIAILFRSASTHIPNYMQVFKAHGIPVSSEATGDFFSAPENAVVLSLLRVVDNPMQDIPLLGVMLSALFGFTPDDLARMKIADRQSALYTCVSHYAKSGDEKTIQFLHTLNRLRTYSVTMPIDAFIQKVYDETAYIAIAKSMGEPEQREANLNLLLSYAHSFSQSGKKGLSAFIRLIDRMKENGQSLPGANLQGGNANAVRLMSIHRSKGLEFPICILAGNSRRYNNASIRENLLLHPELGAGLKVPNEELLCQYTSVPYNAVRLAIQNAEMSENLRVLYVAMTRAREQLIFVLTENALERKLAKLAPAVSGGQVSAYTVGNASCDSDLLLNCALLHPNGALLRRMANAQFTSIPSAAALEIRVIETLDKTDIELSDTALTPPDKTIAAQIEERLSYTYPYRQLACVSAKRNASSLDEQTKDAAYFAAARPAFLSENGLTGAQKGTAMHLFMQHCDYERAQQNVSLEADRMAQKGFLTPQERQSLSEEKLSRFFKSTFAQRIFDAERVLREIKFASFVDANVLYPELEDTEEQIYVQGIADCVFIEAGAMVVVDFKTDRVKEPMQLLNRYHNQLRFYCEALEKIYHIPVKACYLYSFYLDMPIAYDFI